MIPVAGRRKGHAPPTRSAGDPTWLLGDDDPPAAPAAPAHDALAFLDFDDSPPAPRAAAQPPAPAPLPPSASAPAQVTGPSSAFLLNRREELRKDLSGIQEEIAQYEERIKSLEGGQDELCQEVKRLEREACNKREEEERAALIEAEMEESLNLRRQWINERKGEFQKEELTNASNILRMQHTSDIERLKTLIEDQKKSLLVVKERHDKMDGSICATDIYERVLAQLENTLEKSVREMSNSMCVRIKPFLVGSIRETVVQSSQQRLDILSGDRQRRHEEWDHFQEKMKKQFSNFREERRAKHHVEFDSVFAHAVANFRAAADNRLTISTEKFAERQRVITTETYRCTQRAIDEMVQRFNEELNALEKKQTEDVKRTMTQCTSELAHNGRLCAAEKDAVIGRQCRRKQEEENEKNEQGDKLVSTVYKSLEQKLGFLRTKVEQLRQNLAFNIQEISTATSCGGGSAPFSAQEKALILEDCGRKTRQISNQLGVQWKRFQAILAPLEQCVSSMNDELRESRSKVISMQQGAESAYQAWSHDVRRELSRCLTSSGVSEYSEEIQSGVKCMTQVMENVLFQLQSLRVAHTDGHAEQIHFWKSVEKDIAMLSTHHGNFNDTFHAVFDAYDRLSQVEAELEAKRRSLEIAESDYSAAAQQFEREKNEFNARLKVAEELAAELRQQTAILEERTVFGVHMSAESPENLSDMIVENRLGESMARSRAKNLQQRPQSRERQYPAYQHNTLAESVYDHPAVGEEEEKEVKENETPQHRKGDFSANLPGTLAVDEPKLRAFSHTASAEREGRRQSSVGSNYTPSSDRMDSGSGTKSLTTPSTSNS